MLERLLDRFRLKPKSSAPAVKSFTDDQQREGAYDSRVRGVATVALDRIVGSVGRYHDFDHQFRFKPHIQSERLNKIKQAMREGRPLPPVKLYQIRAEYYAVDGNHRIAAAKEFGHDEILAHIVEFIPSGAGLVNVLYREQAEFRDRTQLPDKIRLSEIGQYSSLLDQIAKHQSWLREQKADEVPFKAAAKDWYRTIYRPLCEIIKTGRILDSFPDRTLADLYTYISTHQWDMNRQRRYGSGIDELIAADMEEFRSKMTQTQGTNYPEMRCDITAFVLMNVQARKEEKIIAKLFELDEIQEVHSVHGDVDVLVKINLSRDLLSSDAAIIGQFVQENIRQIPGVISTKTLIPGLSKIKTCD